MKEAPELQSVYLSFRKRGVVFIGLFAMSSEREIRKFAETHRITFPVGKDSGLASAFGVRALPATFIITRDRKIGKRFLGRVDGAELAGAVDSALK